MTYTKPKLALSSKFKTSNFNEPVEIFQGVGTLFLDEIPEETYVKVYYDWNQTAIDVIFYANEEKAHRIWFGRKKFRLRINGFEDQEISRNTANQYGGMIELRFYSSRLSYKRTKLDELIFHIPNCENIYSDEISVVGEEDARQYCRHYEGKIGKYLITIDSIPVRSRSSNYVTTDYEHRTHNQITHVCKVKGLKKVYPNTLIEVANSICLALSLCRAAEVNPNFFIGYADGITIYKEIRSVFQNPYCKRLASFVPWTLKWSYIFELANGIYSESKKSSQRKSEVRASIYWYLAANKVQDHSESLVLVSPALEMLCKINGFSNNFNDGLNISLQKAVELLKLNNIFPKKYTALKSHAKSQKSNSRNTYYWNDPSTSIAPIRNLIMHGEPKFSRSNKKLEAEVQVRGIALWYAEMLLLYTIGFKGEIIDVWRVIDKKEVQKIKVSWA